jgi:hypothetical protein
VTFDSVTGNKFNIHSQSVRKFPMSARGLYYCDMEEQQGNVLVQDGESSKGGNSIATIDRNKAKYTARDVTLADKARKFQETTGASLQTFLDIIDHKLLPNCPITRADIKIAEDIDGTSVAHLKGKTTRKGGKLVSFNLPTLPWTSLCGASKLTKTTHIKLMLYYGNNVPKLCRTR